MSNHTSLKLQLRYYRRPCILHTPKCIVFLSIPQFTFKALRVCSVKTGGFSHLSELWSKQQFYWNCTFILCQQVTRLVEITVSPVRPVHKSAQDRTLNVQHSCFIAFWSLIVTFSHIAILVFPSPNLRPLEIIIKTFLYNLRLFKTPRKPCQSLFHIHSVVWQQKYINENSFIENLAASKYSMWHREANKSNNK